MIVLNEDCVEGGLLQRTVALKEDWVGRRIVLKEDGVEGGLL
jgi:hypothetical protein